MSLKLSQHAPIGSEQSLSLEKHILIVLGDETQNDCPFLQIVTSKLARTAGEWKDLQKTPLQIELMNGGIASVVIVLPTLTVFQKHALLAKAVKPLLDESPANIAIAVYGDEVVREANACASYYVATVNAVQLPTRKKDQKNNMLTEVAIYGYQAKHAYGRVNARVAGNALCRSLTILPPNELTPALYRKKLLDLANTHGWQYEEFDMVALKKIGAGAFVAVAQGSDPLDAAIVHITYAPNDAKQHIALVGKGICFDTGGHNLKPAKYMQGMHEDMNGSAVAVGTLLAATQQALPIKIDCWLAIAQNHISPLAYKQNDVVIALNGMSIEVVHTDAEGRMVLADTLTLASRAKPELIIDFATLTGSMMTALGDRMSGIMSNRPALACKTVGVGDAVGERVVAFPFDEDYDVDLDSDIADIKQCTLEGGADHIHAARFLSKFIEHDVPWVHIDLSSYNRKGGLGAVLSDINGFGVGLSLELLKCFAD